MFNIEEWNKNEWIESEFVQEHFNMSFGECYKSFDHCRTAEWNKYPLHGQKIVNYFRKDILVDK